MTAHLLTLLCGGLVGFSLALTGGGGSTLAVPLLLFALLMIVVAVLMLIPRKPRPVGFASVRFLMPRLMGIGFVAGAAAGFFGVGGGFIIVPGLMLASHMEILKAIGTSLFGVGTFGLTTALNYARSGLVDWVVALEFVAGGVVGGWLGAMAARRLSKTRGALNVAFSIMIITVAIYMLVRTLSPATVGQGQTQTLTQTQAAPVSTQSAGSDYLEKASAQLK